MDLSRGLGKTLSSGRQPQHQITSTAAKIAAPYGPLPTSKRQRSPSITSNKVRSKRKAVEEEEEEKEEEEKEEEEELPCKRTASLLHEQSSRPQLTLLV